MRHGGTPARLAGQTAALAVIVASCALASHPGDPAPFVGDPRYVACAIPLERTWLAFPMAQALDYSLHFPSWFESVPELLTAEPALVVVSNGRIAPGGLTYEICIAVGPPEAATVHRYDPMRFDLVRPDLDEPAIEMP